MSAADTAGVAPPRELAPKGSPYRWTTSWAHDEGGGFCICGLPTLRRDVHGQLRHATCER